jgi:hypothetical protein
MAKSKAARRGELDCQYDVCLSFAGDDRAYVQELAKELTSTNYCDEHADEVLKRLDFSSLSSATIVKHKH